MLSSLLFIMLCLTVWAIIHDAEKAKRRIEILESHVDGLLAEVEALSGEAVA